MAEPTTEFDFDKPHPNRKYDWQSWFDGRVWKLTPGVDFLVTIGNFRSMVYSATQRFKVKVRTHVADDGAFYIQAYPKESISWTETAVTPDGTGETDG